MSLSNLFPRLSREWWDTWNYPSSMYNHHFGTDLLDSDLLLPTMYRGFPIRSRTLGNISACGQSEIKNESDKFKVMLNVCHFKPNQIVVKIVDNSVVIHGKHEEKSDGHGIVSREFTRRYLLPEGVEPDSVKSFYSRGGILTIEAPRKAIEPPVSNERVIPINLLI